MDRHEESWAVRLTNLLDAKQQFLANGIEPGWDEFNDALTLLAEAPAWKCAPDAPGLYVRVCKPQRQGCYVVGDPANLPTYNTPETRWFGPISTKEVE